MKSVTQENMVPNNLPNLGPVFVQKAWGLTGHPLPEGYHIRGFLLQRLVVGQGIMVLRTHAAGREGIGLFMTSPIVMIESPFLVRTLNSAWVILPLEWPRAGQSLLSVKLIGGRPIQCKSCGDIIRVPGSEAVVRCRCSNCFAPGPGEPCEDLLSLAEFHIPSFREPNSF